LWSSASPARIGQRVLSLASHLSGTRLSYLGPRHAITGKEVNLRLFFDWLDSSTFLKEPSKSKAK